MSEAEKKAEAAPKEGAPPAAAEGGGGSKLPLIIALACLVIMPVAGWAVAFFVLKPSIAAKNAAAANPADAHGAAKPADAHGEAKPADAHGEKPKDGHGKEEDKGGGHGGEEEKKGFDKKPEVFEMVVNVAGTRGTRFLRISMSFVAPDSIIKEMDNKKNRPIIHDRLLTLLRSKRLDELDAVDALPRLRNEIVILINSEMKFTSPENRVKGVNFTDFVVQ